MIQKSQQHQQLFKELFKPYFKQFHRFSFVMLVWYVMILFPFFVLEPAISGAGFGIHDMRITVMIFAGFYLLCIPYIFSTMFNLYLLCFESIINFKNSAINKKEVKTKNKNKAKNKAKKKVKDQDSDNQK